MFIILLLVLLFPSLLLRLLNYFLLGCGELVTADSTESQLPSSSPSTPRLEGEEVEADSAYPQAVPSSSSTPKILKYDVFLSFRGEDTRNNFTDHLYFGLKQKGINTFRDGEKLEKGKPIAPKLLKAIEESKFAVVVLSPDYASSTWCLDELAHIVQRMKERRLEVFPVFYHVEVSEIRKKTGNYGKAFSKHEDNFKNEKGKVKKWRDALRTIANVSGWDVKPSCAESEVIQKIGRKISDRLNYTFLSVNEDLIGMRSRLEKMKPFLDLASGSVRSIGIWGTVGLGKTTLAQEVFKMIITDPNLQFEATCFLANVRLEFEKVNGLVYLQNLLYKRLLYEEANIQNSDMGICLLRNKLRSTKVLIILDDVDNSEQIKGLVGDKNEENPWFGPGSRVIITTRDERLLDVCGVLGHNIYEVEKMNNDEAFQLLCLKVFKKNHCPDEHHIELLNKFVKYASGIPLALRVLGASLHNQKVDYWPEELGKLDEDPSNLLFDVLRTSFNGLSKTEKETFLHIACFFKGEDQSRVEKILERCRLFPKSNIDNLIHKSLIKIERDKLWMHDLLQHMGWQIVREESLRTPGERSRLWVSENVSDYKQNRSWLYVDARSVLTKNTGTHRVEGIFLCFPEKEEIHLNADPFSNMSNLRLLKIFNANFSGCLEYLSEELRVLEWHECPLESLPSSFRPDQLVELKMPNSCIKNLTDLSLMEHLVQIDLSNCKCLTKTLDFSKTPKLEGLILEGCEKLSELHPTVGDLQHLVLLNLKGCESLKGLPHSISLTSLETFILSGCSKLNQFPEIAGKMEDLSQLYLDGTAIRELPVTIQKLKGLTLLNLRGCNKLLSLPRMLISLTSLKYLYLSGCSCMDQLPENIERLEHLEELDAGETGIKKVPTSILLMKNLKRLSFRRCKDVPTEFSESMGLQLPKSFSGLSSLISLNLCGCGLQEGAIPDDIGCYLSLLQRLDLSENDFVSLPESISELSELRQLRLFGCSKLQSLPKILPAKLTNVNARECPMLINYSNNLTLGTSDKGFNFISCGKSDESEDDQTIDTPLSASDYHIELLFPKFIEERIYNEEPFEIRFPHSAKIPNWCSQSSSGASVTIQLSDPEDNEIEWIGFTLFIAFKIHEIDSFDKSWELQETSCHFYTNEGRLRTPLVFQNFNDFKVGLSYGLCCYEPRGGKFARQLNKSSRLLGASVSTNRPDMEVKGCGIRLISHQDVADCIHDLTETANQHLDFNFGQHCKEILDKAMELERSGNLTELGPVLQKLPSASTVKHGSFEDFSKIHTREELGLRSHCLLKLLYEGRNGREKNFHFSFRHPIISHWFHHYAGDVALCYLPPNLYDDERWIGLELYAVFTWSPSNLSEHNPLASLLLHVDLCSPARSIMHSSIKILDFFGCHQRVVLHFPRACFPQHELNQCKGISALFRTSSPDVEVQVCGSRLVYEQDLEELIEALIVESAYMDPHVALRDLSLQAQIHVESIEKCFLREAEADEHSAVALDGETRKFIEICKGQLLNIGSSTPVPEQVSTSRLQKYKSYLEQKQGFILGPAYMIVHSKRSLLETRDSIKEHVVEIKSKSLVSHLHVMTETQIYGSCNLAKWKKDLEMLLQNAEEATLSLKGHTISVLRHFDPSFGYNFCFPQKEILEWFKGQSTESSRVGIHLPPGLYDDNNWRGLVICAAYTVHELPAATLENLGSELSVKLLCHLRTEEYCLNPMPLYSTTKEKFKWLYLRRFIWLTYIPRVFLAEFNEVRDVEARIYNNCPGLSVENCAVRLLYQNEVEELKQSITECWTSFFDNSDLVRQFVEQDETFQRNQ